MFERSSSRVTGVELFISPRLSSGVESDQSFTTDHSYIDQGCHYNPPLENTLIHTQSPATARGCASSRSTRTSFWLADDSLHICVACCLHANRTCVFLGGIHSSVSFAFPSHPNKDVLHCDTLHHWNRSVKKRKICLRRIILTPASRTQEVIVCDCSNIDKSRPTPPPPLARWRFAMMDRHRTCWGRTVAPSLGWTAILCFIVTGGVNVKAASEAVAWPWRASALNTSVPRAPFTEPQRRSWTETWAE